MAEDRYPDAHFAGLVQAASAAADQEIQWSNHADSGARQSYDDYGDHSHLSDAHNSVQNGQYNEAYLSESAGPSTRKRKRDTETGAAQYEAEISPPAGSYQSRTARPPIGAPSAAALFRQPLPNTKKYTRPPIGKLYSSLELSPENFLHLQSAAKTYMLDENYPERRDTIGQKGRGDIDLVKLKLWNFTKEFLDDLGNGQKYFGEHVPANESQSTRTMVWPQDAEQIIKVCVPVLRKMVTNERQRQYALESRKAGPDAAERQHEEDEIEQAPATKTSVPNRKLSKKDITQLEILDLLSDCCVPETYEAADWYEERARDPRFRQILLSSTLSERNCRILVANLDGHYRNFHHRVVSQCKDDCETKMFDRLLEWERLYDPEITPDIHERRRQMADVIRQLADLLKEHLTPQEIPANAEKRRTKPTRQSAAKSALESRIEATEGVLSLQVNVVSVATPGSGSSTNSPKRLVAPFSVNAAAVPNLDALSSKIQEHYGLGLQQLCLLERSGSAGPGVVGSEERKMTIRVWLPDGLVPIRDDGEWMVALLSAEMIEWMDKEVKILVDFTM